MNIWAVVPGPPITTPGDGRDGEDTETSHYTHSLARVTLLRPGGRAKAEHTAIFGNQVQLGASDSK